MPDDPTHEEEEEEEEEDTFQLTDDQTADFRDAFKKFDAAGKLMPKRKREIERKRERERERKRERE